MNDVAKLKSAIETYRAQTGTYPKASASDEGPSVGALQSFLVPAYLTSLPHDPKFATGGGDYYYVWGDNGSAYGIWINFENSGACATGVNVNEGWWRTTSRCQF